MKKAAGFALLIVAVIAVIFGVITVKHNRQYKALDEQRWKDFKITDTDRNRIYRPVGMMTPEDHFLLVGPKASLLFYCKTADNCIFGEGVTRDSLAEAITQMFSDLNAQRREQQAAQQRAIQQQLQQQSFHGDPAKAPAPVVKAPPKLKQHSSIRQDESIIQHSSGANSPNIAGVTGNVNITSK